MYSSSYQVHYSPPVTFLRFLRFSGLSNIYHPYLLIKSNYLAFFLLLISYWKLKKREEIMMMTPYTFPGI